MSENIEHDDQADADAPGDGPDERTAVSWGPTLGAEAAADAARPAPARTDQRRGWHPPGGSI